MPKINVYLPEDLAEAVRDAGVPVSAVCQRALEVAVRRVTALREVAVGDLNAEELAARLPQFTARTRAVLTLATDQAQADGSADVGTTHLLHGMLVEGGNLALQVLRALEIDPDRIERDLTQRGSGEPRPSADTTLPRLSGPAAGALELTVTEATALGHNYVGCEHLLLGLIAEPDGTAGQILRGLGAELRLTRRAVVAALAGYGHLRTQTATTASSTAAASDAEALTIALRNELQPLVKRIENLEALTATAQER